MVQETKVNQVNAREKSDVDDESIYNLLNNVLLLSFFLYLLMVLLDDGIINRIGCQDLNLVRFDAFRICGEDIC
jgi:hypothetical protein